MACCSLLASCPKTERSPERVDVRIGYRLREWGTVDADRKVGTPSPRLTGGHAIASLLTCA